MTITTEVRASAALQALHTLATQLANPTQANKGLAVKLAAWVDRNFKVSGGLAGGWAPLGPMSRKLKPRRGFPLEPLITTGHATTLQRSFLPFWGADHAGIGSKTPHAKYHEYGVASTRGWVLGKSIPVRPMLPSRAVAAEMAMQVYGFFIDTARRGAGL